MDLASIQAWAEAHPALVALVLIPLGTAIFNLLFKPKTPEQYATIAAVSPRLAAFLQLMGALGVDPDKAWKIVSGKIVKGTPSTKGQALVLLVGALCLSTSACSPKAWSALDVLSRAIQCAVANQNLPDDFILKKCEIGPEDIERVLTIVAVSRVEAANESIAAAGVQAAADREAGVCK
jgi:hypothetical protein